MHLATVLVGGAAVALAAAADAVRRPKNAKNVTLVNLRPLIDGDDVGDKDTADFSGDTFFYLTDKLVLQYKCHRDPESYMFRGRAAIRRAGLGRGRSARRRRRRDSRVGLRPGARTKACSQTRATSTRCRFWRWTTRTRPGVGDDASDAAGGDADRPRTGRRRGSSADGTGATRIVRGRGETTPAAQVQNDVETACRYGGCPDGNATCSNYADCNPSTENGTVTGWHCPRPRGSRRGSRRRLGSGSFAARACRTRRRVQSMGKRRSRRPGAVQRDGPGRHPVAILF